MRSLSRACGGGSGWGRQLLAHVVLHGLERVIDAVRIDAATLTDLAAAAALPPRDLAERLNQIVRRQPVGKRARDLEGKIATGDDDRHAVAIGAVEHLVSVGKQILFLVVDPLQNQADAIHLGLFQPGASSGCQPLAKVRGVFLEALDLRLQGYDPGRQLRGRRSQDVA